MAENPCANPTDTPTKIVCGHLSFSSFPAFRDAANPTLSECRNETLDGLIFLSTDGLKIVLHSEMGATNLIMAYGTDGKDRQTFVDSVTDRIPQVSKEMKAYCASMR